MPKLVLSVGLDTGLLRSRNALLRDAVYAVASATILQARKRFSSRNFEVVVLCHSIPELQRHELMRWMKSEKPNVPVLSIHKPGQSAGVVAQQAVNRMEDPEQLLSRVKALIEGGENPTDEPLAA